MTAAQLDWIDLLVAAPVPQFLAAVVDALSRFPADATGKAGAIRQSLLWHHAALLGQRHDGAAIPADVYFKDGFTSPEISGWAGQHHSWAISDSHMEMAGGFGCTPEDARASAMVGLMLSINEPAHGRQP
ncbi:hypothetical protein GJ700_12565 [Duganella sp. FT92W]|uniref:Uncharacterized protein n=1 Tax=Pseudoduganella rivuli TaxID=2666085 RepID=A0A7X2LU06_9BURK|nr:hypothetical protein [Pseudoduganella rivuli]MRV72542.1 hypothetical protein [Pseudoduganella rivuli]